jgi:haloalkane dehalogenase
MVLEQNLFLRTAFTGGGVLTPVSDDDMKAYLEPFPTPQSRRPILAWARQIPLGGEPAGLVVRIETFDAWLATSTSVPKLLLTFEGAPSLLIGNEMVVWCATHIASLETVSCGQAGHHAPEDRPKEDRRRNLRLGRPTQTALAGRAGSELASKGPYPTADGRRIQLIAFTRRR